MAELGTYYITIMPDMSQFTGEVKAALGTAGATGGKSFGGKFSDVLKGSAIGTALGGLAQRAGSSIMNGLDVGIRRLDTLKNYPKVMESLGYSTDDADRSISTIMQHLDGLPSSTQDLVTLTQAISDSTGDLDLATAAALGFNDMLLANGASASEVATAQGVLNRVLGKGSATAAQWQSLTSVMPAQLGMVAKSMLGAGATTEDLHSALEDGTVSWNDFLGAIAELDQSGYIDENGRKIASFTEQARANSHGIGTAIENVKNRIGAGWASIFDAVGQEAISGTIDRMSYGVKNAMQRIADGITYLKDKIGQTKIGENLAKIGESVGGALKNLAETGAEKLKPIADAMVDLIDKGLQWVVDHGDAVKTALGGISGALAVLGGWKLGTDLMQLPGILGGIAAAISANPLMALALGIGAVAMGLYTFFTQTETGKQIWSDFTDLLSTTWEGLKKDWGVLTDTLSREWQSFQDFINGIPDWYAGVQEDWKAQQEKINKWFDDAINSKLRNLWEGLKKDVGVLKDTCVREWNDMKSSAGKTWDKLKSDAKTKWDNIKSTISTAWTNIKTNATTKANEVKSAVSSGWDNIKSTTTTKWNNIKSAISTAWTNIKSDTTTKVNEVKSAASTAWDNMKSTASSKWDSIKSTISTKMNDAKSAVSTKLSEMRSAITSFAPKFNAIAAPVIGSISGALQSIRDKVTSFKPSFPRISWPTPSMPHIPTPHFSISWNSILGGVVKIPKVSFSGWWAKGGVFDTASIIGIGEAGREAALPLNRHVYGEIARGITDEMGGAGGVVVTGNTFYVREEADIDRIAEALNRKIRRERWAMA